LSDHVVDRPSRELRGSLTASGAMAVGPLDAPRDSGGAGLTLERAAWLALMPLVFVMAVVLTVGYAIAVLVVDLRS
jgi:hypothetical protein